MDYYQEILQKATKKELEKNASGAVKKDCVDSFLKEFIDNAQNAGLHTSDKITCTTEYFRDLKRKLGNMQFSCQMSSSHNYEVWRLSTKTWNVCLTIVYEHEIPFTETTFKHHVMIQGMNSQGDHFAYTGNILDIWERFTKRLFVDTRKKNQTEVRSNFNF